MTAFESFRNRLEDFRYNTFHYLCSKYDHIIVQKFGSKRMSARADRRLRTKTVEPMLCLGHGKFREVLIQTVERIGKNGEERVCGHGRAYVEDVLQVSALNDKL